MIVSLQGPSCEIRRRRFSRQIGHFGLRHPRPAPWALSLWDPLVGPSVTFLVLPREYLDPQVLPLTHPPAAHARVRMIFGEYMRVIVRSLQRRPTSLVAHTSSHLTSVHRRTGVWFGCVLRGRDLWLNS